MIAGILQARTSSRRLPGKVMRPILGAPMLQRQIERLKRARVLDELVVATSVESSDDAIETLCRELGVICFRGSLDDVLDRFYQTASMIKCSHAVRVTGDCPLIDPKVLDQVVTHHLAGNYDYTSNALERTYPDGLDVEVMTFAALETTWKEAHLSSEREHVTPFLYKHPERFRIGHVRQAEDWSAVRLTVDEEADLVVVQRIYEALYPNNPCFGLDEILSLIKAEPELLAGNDHIELNEGYKKSLSKD